MNPYELAQVAVQDYEACQKPAELAALLAVLACDPPKLVLEIGTLAGGCVWAWSQVAHPKAVIVGVDIQPHDHSGLVKDTQTYVPVIGDSTDPDTVNRVGQVLGGHLPDFSFIDGDHAEAVADADLGHYRGHITALHDIAHPLDGFWNSLRNEGSVSLLNDPQRDDGWGPWGGIGVLWSPS